MAERTCSRPEIVLSNDRQLELREASMKPAVVILVVIACCARLPGQTREDTDREFIVPAATASAGLSVQELSKSVAMVIKATNSFREEKQLQSVTTDEQLRATAQKFADFMASTDKYGHHADGRTAAERATGQGYELCLIAENIAYQYNSEGFSVEALAKGFVEGWKESPGHRRNMLEPAATETGVAIARGDESGIYYAVQLFGRPKSAQIAFQVRNQSETSLTYEVGERSFTLPSGYTREHRQCTQATLKFSPDKESGERTRSFEIENGSRYAVQPTGEVRLESFEVSNDALDGDERQRAAPE
jgi:uncharacterized protein YkwD